MMRKSSSASGLGDVALCGLFVVLSLLVGIFVVTVLLVASSPLVGMFPIDSGAHEIVLGVALMWGVVTGCVVAVFTIGPYRRLRAGAQFESFEEGESLPLEMIGRPVAPKRAANDTRRRRPVAVVADEDEDDELLLEEEAELPRRRPAAPRRV